MPIERGTRLVGSLRIRGRRHKVDGCGVCGSGDVQYVLETDVGVDAATLAGGNIVRAAFCSVDCLAEKLGLARVTREG